MRCYEFYVMIKNNPARCDKSDSMVSRITQYVAFMESKGVNFDKSETDKARFILLQKEEGLTEKAVTQPTVARVQEQPTEIQVPNTETAIIQPSLPILPVEFCPVSITGSLLECTRCHMASRDCTNYKDETLCPRCLENARYKPDKKPVESASVTTTIQKTKDTWEQRKAHMQVPVSKMEERVLVKLEAKGLHPEVQKEFCVQPTRPDYYFPQQNVAVYLDGEVHKGREDRDETLRGQLRRRHGIKVVTVIYEGDSAATEDKIVQDIMGALG